MQDLKTNRKKRKTTRNQQNREKAGKKPKSGKMDSQKGAGLV
jgi:hypothetical protein